jgi:hypothetical protein
MRPVSLKPLKAGEKYAPAEMKKIKKYKIDLKKEASKIRRIRKERIYKTKILSHIRLKSEAGN